MLLLPASRKRALKPVALPSLHLLLWAPIVDHKFERSALLCHLLQGPAAARFEARGSATSPAAPSHHHLSAVQVHQPLLHPAVSWSLSMQTKLISVSWGVTTPVPTRCRCASYCWTLQWPASSSA